MKVLLVTPFLGLKGHFLEYATKLARGLDSLGDEIAIAFIAGLTPIGDLPATKMVPIEISKHLREGVMDNYSGSKAYYTIQKLKSCNQFYELLAASRSADYDVAYHLDYEYLALMYSWSGTRIRYIAKTHGIWIHSASVDGSLIYKAYKSAWFAWLKYAKPNKIEGYVVNGKTIAEAFSAVVPNANPVVTIPYPGDTIDSTNDEVGNDLTRLVSLKRPIGLCFGIIRKDKNIYLSAKACLQAGVSVAIVGFPKDVDTGEFEKLASENPDNVVYVPRYVSDSEIDYTFKHSDFCMMCYEESNVSQSGPLALARAYKIPAVVSRAPELSSYVRDADVGEVAEALNVDSMSRAVKSITSRDYSSALDKAADFGTWSSTINRYHEFFANLGVES